MRTAVRRLRRTQQQTTISEPVADPAARAPHPISVMTEALAIPIVSVNRDQLEGEADAGQFIAPDGAGVGCGQSQRN
jgi:hypothetical protein